MNNEKQSLFWFKCLRWFLWLIGGVTLFAFAAAVMPEKWMIEASEFLGFSPFPNSPLTFYLARNLSLLYGFVGVLMLYLARDIFHYRKLIRTLSLCTVAFGFFQFIVDTQASMPLWWSASESSSTLFGGVFFYWLQSKVDWSSQQGA
jgi:hypothetical protein